MSYPHAVRITRALLSVALAAGAGPCFAAGLTGTEADQTVVITAQKAPDTIENAPSSHASIDAATIAATVNATNVEDTLKYLPSLVIRKRHIGDTQ